MKPLPIASQSYALLMQDEKLRDVHFPSNFIFESTWLNVSINVNSGSNGNNFKENYENRKHLSCIFCKKSGHIANKCYRLVGFPKDFKFTKTRNATTNVSNASCF